jgi:hypothetical protein
MSYCLDGSCKTLDLWAATTVDVGDLQLQDSSHPNVMPFSGTLLLLDEPSNQPPHGADGHQILVPTSVAKNRLNTLPGMAINYEADLTGHNPGKKVGVITQASIEGNKVQVKGLVWKKDFPEAARLFKMNKGRLGMSMELGDVYVRDKDERVWHLEDFHFTGATVLLKDHAAYEKTDLAASKFFVKALAAASSARGIFRKGGKLEMADKDTKKKDNGQSSGAAVVTAISAAVEKGIKAGIDSVLASQKEVNEKLFGALDGISASQEEIAKGLHELAIGDVNASSDDEEAIDVNADATDATMQSDATDATMSSSKKSDASDSTDPSDASDVDAESSNEGDPTNYTSSDQGDDAEPGNLNKDAEALAKSKARSGSTQMSPGGKSISKGIAASRRERVVTMAAAKVIKTLKAEKQAIAAENVKLRNKVKSIEASLDRFADRVERKSITPEIHALLEKHGYDARELMASKTRLSVADVDAMLANSGVILEPTMRMAFKNQLSQAGLMDQGQVIRTH